MNSFSSGWGNKLIGEPVLYGYIEGLKLYPEIDAKDSLYRGKKLRGNEKKQRSCLGKCIQKSRCLSGWRSCFQIRVSAGVTAVPGRNRI